MKAESVGWSARARGSHDNKERRKYVAPDLQPDQHRDRWALLVAFVAASCVEKVVVAQKIVPTPAQRSSMICRGGDACARVSCRSIGDQGKAHYTRETWPRRRVTHFVASFAVRDGIVVSLYWRQPKHVLGVEMRRASRRTLAHMLSKTRVNADVTGLTTWR